MGGDRGRDQAAGACPGAGELATISEHGFRITVVVVDDGGYGMLRYAAERRFGRTFAADLVSRILPALPGRSGCRPSRASWTAQPWRPSCP
ncbi:MAG: thiamine pyrophosphate-dependent enzyme, partial [Actinomycetota bacterium]